METKIEIDLKGEKYFISEKNPGEFGLRVFDILSKKSNEIVLNDDGREYKSKLKKFDISKDKKIGRYWHFVVNDKSRELIREVLRNYYNNHGGHFNWCLRGNGFTVDCWEVGDELVYPEYTEKGISDVYEINLDESLKEEINEIKEEINKREEE